MTYFLYLSCLILLTYSVLSFYLPQKTRRVVYFLAYLAPFWVWGFIALFVSTLIWQYREIASVPFIISTFAIIGYIKGIYLIFMPKRKIKKKLELWSQLPDNTIKSTGFFALFIAFILFLAIR